MTINDSSNVSAKPETTKPAPPPGTSRKLAGGPFRLLGKGWRRLWRTAAAAEARAALPVFSARQADDLRRAMAVRELAIGGMSSSQGSDTARARLPALVTLTRDAAFSALSASLPDPAPENAGAALERLPPTLLGELVPDETARERVRAALTAPSDEAAWARRPLDEQRQAFRELGLLSTALLRRLLRPRRQLRCILLRRVALGAALVVLLVAAVEAASIIEWRPSLTAGKPWHASSALDVCKPQEHYCADAITDIFFCTTEEASPWVEFDLGERRTFSRVVVRNRSDCCPDRAVPLALEVSDDQQTWREVARRDETFSTWRSDFPTTRARYARLRALRRTILHLDKFDLYR
ncbi:MAG TPA: discoidin domain-containing protein [Polyangia bacterium]|jgi:hypothetical protein